MNVEKYVIPEVYNDNDWNYLLGRTLEKDRIWDPSNKSSSGVTPIKSHQLLVSNVLHTIVSLFAFDLDFFITGCRCLY